MANIANRWLGSIRHAVAIALLWANSAWAQVEQQTVQPVEEIRLDLSERPAHYSSAVTASQPGASVQSAVSGPGSEKRRGLSLRLATGTSRHQCRLQGS